MLLENLRTIFRLRDYYRHHYETGVSDEAFIQWLAKSIPRMLEDNAAAPAAPDHDVHRPRDPHPLIGILNP